MRLRRENAPEAQIAVPRPRGPDLANRAAQGAAGSRSGTPYTPRPEAQTRSQRRKPWAALLCTLALAIAGGYGALAYLAPGSAGGLWPFAAEAGARVLRVTAQDLDVEATEMARAMLASGEWNAPLTPPPADAASRNEAAGATGRSVPVPTGPERTTPDVARGMAGSDPGASQASTTASERKRRRVRVILQTAPESTRRDLQEGRQALYVLHVIDNVEEDGDAVIIQVNGVPYGEVLLSHAGQSLMIPLPAGALSQLRVLAIRDGGGGVTFGARSSVGDVRSKVMQVGDSDNWTVVPR